MQSQVQKWVKTCDSCQRAGSKEVRRELNSSEVIGVSWKVHMDSVHIGKGRGGKKKIIGICCDLTGYIDGNAVKEANAKETLTVIKEFISWYGCPNVIVTDGGSEFDNQEVEALLRADGIALKITSAYHPQANSVIERRWPEIR